MKPTLTIILFILLNGCGYGQYPDTRYKGNDVGVDSFPCSIICYTTLPPTCDTFWCDKKDSSLRLDVSNAEYYFDDKMPYGDGFLQRETDMDNMPYKDSDIQMQWFYDTIPVTEASFYYWKQYLFFKHESDKQKDIIKKQRNPSYKEYDRLMDSVLRYKKLIDGLKKQSYE